MDRRERIEESVNNGFNVRDELKHMNVEELRAYYSYSTLPFSVCALNVEGDLNIGMMARTASLFGARKFYVFGRRKIDNRSLVGAQNYLPIERVEGLDSAGNVSIEKFSDFLLREKLSPILIEQGGISLETINWNKVIMNSYIPPVLVFGNEANGMPKSFLELWTKVSIPQVGVLRSFNVAAAASIVMWEVYKQFTYDREKMLDAFGDNLDRGL